MSEKEIHIYNIILEHIEVCNKRFATIKEAGDFTKTAEGNTILDAIVTRLQAIGENVKRLIKQNTELQVKYPQINWYEIIQFRDFISHHYELLDYEIVFEICTIHLPLLKNTITTEINA